VGFLYPSSLRTGNVLSVCLLWQLRTYNLAVCIPVPYTGLARLDYIRAKGLKIKLARRLHTISFKVNDNLSNRFLLILTFFNIIFLIF
jgi:hypothetical protein